MYDMNMIQRIDDALAPMCKAIGEKIQAGGDAIIEAFDKFMNAATAKIAEKTVAVKDGISANVNHFKDNMRANEGPSATPAIKKDAIDGPVMQKEISSVADKLPEHSISQIDTIRASLEKSYSMPSAVAGVNESELCTGISASAYSAAQTKSNVVGLGF